MDSVVTWAMLTVAGLFGVAKFLIFLADNDVIGVDKPKIDGIICVDIKKGKKK